jgi:hypothetical protein
LIFFNLPQSKRGVYLLALYPALSAIVAITFCDEIVAGDPVARFTTLLSRGFGAVFVGAGGVAAIAVVMLHLGPGLIEAALRKGGILVPDLTVQLAAQTRTWPVAAIFLPIALVVLGVYLSRARPTLVRLMTALVAAQVCLVLAINLVVEPAIAKTLALKQFAADARRLAGPDAVGYFGNLDYGFAFYNGRDLRLTSPLDADAPRLIVSPEDDWKLVSPRLSADYTVLLRSNPTQLDGSGRMLLLQRISGSSPPANDSGKASSFHI